MILLIFFRALPVHHLVYAFVVSTESSCVKVIARSSWFRFLAFVLDLSTKDISKSNSFKSSLISAILFAHNDGVSLGVTLAAHGTHNSWDRDFFFEYE